MKKIIIILLLIVFNTSEIFSNDLLFKPLEANVLEPRVSTIYQLEDEKLRLDIGNSIDLFKSKISNSDNDIDISFGTEFFVITRLRSEGRMKFPVETSDFYFGINSTGKLPIDDNNLFWRLRLAHISSHLVDGMAEGITFERKPFVYSREFIDLVFAIEINKLRPYLGTTWIFSTIPDDVNSFIPQIGIDYQNEIFTDVDLIAGYDFKLDGYNSIYCGVNSIKLGLLFKTFENLGVEIIYNYYSGLSMHGMYFREKDEYNALGFNIIFY